MLKILACIVFTSILNFSYAQLFGGQIKNNSPLVYLYPSGNIYCSTYPTSIVDITNPTTGKTWMDRNLGATQVATSSTDAPAYGDLYQWGRRSDGHQCRTSATTTTLSSVDQPVHGDFIIPAASPADWRSPQNTNLWQGVNGVNNPCPLGYRVPTQSELTAERNSWASTNSTGAFNSPLKWTMAGCRQPGGNFYLVNSRAYYWSSTVSGINSFHYDVYSLANVIPNGRAHAMSVRCIKETVGSIGLNCGSTTITGILISGTAASGVNASVPYTAGNGGFYPAQTVSSTGVIGLSASISQGLFASGAGNLVYTITGTPSTNGTASFALNIGGQSCSLDINILSAISPTYPANSVFCANGPTTVVDVTNPTTGKTWMDRNLGATQVATSSTDAAAYGDLYQWGRRSDGHQCRNSATTTTLSSVDQPAHGDFIRSSLEDWRSPMNDNLWQGVNGINNPCPNGYRLPSQTELNQERLSWSQNNNQGAFISPLKLPMSGQRSNATGGLSNIDGFYWSNSVSSNLSPGLVYNSTNAFMNGGARALGYSVRCIKN